MAIDYPCTRWKRQIERFAALKLLRDHASSQRIWQWAETRMREIQKEYPRHLTEKDFK